MKEQMRSPVVYVVIPVFNRLEFTRACLSCLLRQTYRSQILIVVDGGSTDGTPDAIRREFPGVIVLQGEKELWWAGAMHAGITYALEKSQNQSDMVLMMNDDTVIQPGYVETLVRVSLAQRAAVGGLIVDMDDPARIVDGGEFIDWRTYSFPVKTHLDPGETFFDRVDILPGRGTVVPLRMIRIAGNVDDHLFPHYIADYEFFLRLRRHGFRLGVSREARILAHLKETGLFAEGFPIEFRQAWALVSSRSSMNNFKDHWRFIGHCAPRRYMFLSRMRLLWRTAHIFVLQTRLRYIVWPIVLCWWLRFIIYDRYYVTAADCARYGLDAKALSAERILSPWRKSDWYKFARDRREWWGTRPELRGLYRCAWNPSTKLRRWVKARAHRAGQQKAA